MEFTTWFSQQAEAQNKTSLFSIGVNSKNELQGLNHLPDGSVVMVNTIGQILAGDYKATITYSELFKRNSALMGLGTFHDLNGEGIVAPVEGKTELTQVTSGFVVHKPDPCKTTTPFALLARIPEGTPVSPVAQTLAYPEGVKEQVLASAGPHDRLCAVCIQVESADLLIRTVPCTQEPKPFSDIVQEKRDLKNVSGVLVGFYGPDALKSTVGAGMHLHFDGYDEDGHKIGGHLLGGQIQKGTIQVAPCHAVYLADKNRNLGNLGKNYRVEGPFSFYGEFREGSVVDQEALKKAQIASSPVISK